MLTNPTVLDKEAPTPVLQEKEVTSSEVDHAGPIFARENFCPVTEMIELYRTGKKIVIGRDGSHTEVDLDPSEKAAILGKLMEYAYSKKKPLDQKGSGAVTYNIQIVKFSK